MNGIFLIMPVGVAATWICFVFRSRGAGCLWIRKKTLGNMTGLNHVSGLVGLRLWYAGKCLKNLVVLMKYFLPIWKKLTCAGACRLWAIKSGWSLNQ